MNNCIFSRVDLCLASLIACIASSMCMELRASEAEEWRLPSAEELASQRMELAQSIRNLSHQLGDSANAHAWRQYLLWDALARANRPETDSDFICQLDAIGDLRSVYNRLSVDQAGLELAPFQQLRDQLKRRIKQLNAITTRRAKRESTARRARLAALLEKDHWTAEAQSEYLQHLRWLDDRGQKIPASLFLPGSPNLRIRIRASAIQNISSKMVSEPGCINECIVGTRVLGSGVTVGKSFIKLGPNQAGNAARLIAHFDGTSISDTVGYNGPVRVYSKGVTTLTGRAELEISDQGLRLGSTWVDASTSSRTRGISTNFRGLVDRVVKGVARQQIARKKRQADCESTQKARHTFRIEFEQELIKRVQEGDVLFQKFVRLPLLRRDLMPVGWTWSTNADALTTSLYFNGRRDISASFPAPFASGTGDVEIVCHQSFLENAVEGYLAGRFVDLEELSTAAAASSGSLNSEIAIRLADEQPLRCELDGDELKLRLQCGQIVVDGTEYSGATFLLHFQIVTSQQGVLLKQISKPVLEPAPRYSSKPVLGARGSALRSLVEPILQRDLPREINLSMEQKNEGIPDELRDFRITGFSTRNGWLQLTLRVNARQ